MRPPEYSRRSFLRWRRRGSVLLTSERSDPAAAITTQNWRKILLQRVPLALHINAENLTRNRGLEDTLADVAMASATTVDRI